MGRALLISVLGVAFTVVAVSLSKGEGLGRFARQQAVSEAAAIAHEAAESGFGVAAAAIRADLAARPLVTNVKIDGDSYGTYSSRATDTHYATVAISAVGRYGDARYEIDGEVIELFPTGAPLLIHAETANVEVKDGAEISGTDHRPPSVSEPLRAGAAGPHPALAFTEAETRTQTLGEASSDTRARLKGASESALVPPPTSISTLVETIRASGTTTVVSSLDLKNAVLGSPTSPVVYYATGDVKLDEGVRGYGILVADKKVEMKKDALWEGLIILRAEADSKAELKMQDDARIVGGVVLLGEEDLEEEPNSPGLPGGHFDLDIFAGDGAPLSRIYHKHEWDDTYDLTYLDFASAPDLGRFFADFKGRMSAKDVRVEFANIFNASGTFAIGSGMNTWSGASRSGFDQTLKLSTLNHFRLDFASLQELRGTYPGRVKNDPTGRDRSFTVRFYDGAKLVYAVSVYEHTKGLPRDGLMTTTPGPSSESVEVYGEFKVKLEDDAQLLYSEEAMGRIGRVLSDVRAAGRTQTLVTRSVPVGA